ncbi:MAG: MFS transporter [Treponema sp.]|jgi:fucose permease|nr:MFS transporter [Treponema sp.]
MEDKRFRFFVPAAAGLTFFLGFESGGFQLALLQVAKEFSLGKTMMGILVAVQFSAITSAPLLFGHIADKTGKRKILLFFMPVFFAGCIFTALSGSVGFFIAGIFLTGIGYSVCECISSSALSDTFPGKENRYLNLVQSTFGFGAVVSPILLNRLLSTGLFSWRIIFYLAAAGYAVLYPLMLVSRCGKADCSSDAKKKSVLEALLHPPLLAILFGAIAAYVAMETSVAYFADSLFVMEYNNTVLGAYAVSGFWLAMTLSRFVFAWLQIKSCIVSFFGFALPALLFVLLLFLKHEIPLLIFFIFLGAMMGPVWPMIVGMGTSSYPGISGMVSSILMVGGGIGGAVIPVLIGTISEVLGLHIGFSLLAFISLGGFFLMARTKKFSPKM